MSVIYKVNVKGQDLGHYPVKLLKHFRIVQNVFAFLCPIVQVDANYFYL